MEGIAATLGCIGPQFTLPSTRRFQWPANAATVAECRTLCSTLHSAHIGVRTHEIAASNPLTERMFYTYTAGKTTDDAPGAREGAVLNGRTTQHAAARCPQRHPAPPAAPRLCTDGARTLRGGR